MIAETTALAPGRALDVGCGEGADTVFLAGQGWDVTALDISSRAVERTVAAAAAANLTVTGVAASLLDASLCDASFDLVSAQYPALLRSPDRRAEHRLLDLVVPGGTLLIVHHEPNVEHARAHGFEPNDYVAPGHVRDLAVDHGGWRVVTDARRARHVTSGAGAHHTHDLVVRLHRLG